MATTYSTNLQLIKIGTGEQAGTWGDTTNYNIGTLVEQAISGYATVSFAAGDVTLTMDPGLSCTARNIYLELTGATAARNLIVPGTSPTANNKLYFVYNNSGYNITVKVSGQTGVTLPNGAKSVLVCNGTDVVNAINYIAGGTTASSFIPVGSTVPTNGMYLSATNTLNFATDTTNRLTISSAGNIYPTSGTTSMTDGFFYVPSAAGKPTGTATTVSGRTPMYYDETGNQLYTYNTTNASWSTPTINVMKNRIINGAMNIVQRGTSFTGVTNGSAFAADRFGYGFLGNCVGTVSQDSSVPSNNQFLYSAKMAVTTATGALAAGNYVVFQQTIEGFNVRDLIGQPFTLSFWIKSSVTGTYCIGFRNAGVGTTADRSYVVEYTINAANTWEYKTITVSGGLITAGNWDWINGIGLVVTWVLAVGSNYITTANAWQTGNYVATTNQVNAAATVGNIVQITGVQLERGASATAFEYRNIGLESTLCQRYYEYTANTDDAVFWSGNTTSGNVYYQTQHFMTPKRTNPTITLYGNEGVQGYPAVPTITVGGAGSPYGFRVGSVATGTNSASYYRCYWTASAEF